MRIRKDGAVTAWASLRWQGAAYFDGTADGAGGLLRVPLLRRSGGHRTDDPGAEFGRSQLAWGERQFVAGLWCTTPTRAVFDEVVRLRRLRSAVVASCMTVAAGVTSVADLREYAATRPAWEGIPLFREVVELCVAGFRSPPEVWFYLRWLLDAQLDPPLVNRPLFDLDGNLLGIPDLFDPAAGLVGEYDGAVHKGRARHRRDVAREQRFRDHGLECATVVAGDLRDERLVVSRIRSARRRALFLPPERRSWTLTPPPWWDSSPPKSSLSPSE